MISCHATHSAGVTVARKLYEDIYCARGEMENRIKECQTDLFVGRTIAATMRANQLRLWFAAFAIQTTIDDEAQPIMALYRCADAPNGAEMHPAQPRYFSCQIQYESDHWEREAALTEKSMPA